MNNTVDRNKPIPGFEGVYTGTVGCEKAVHKTHFTVPGKCWKNAAGGDSEWVETKYRHWKLVRKVKDG